MMLERNEADAALIAGLVERDLAGSVHSTRERDTLVHEIRLSLANKSAPPINPTIAK